MADHHQIVERTLLAMLEGAAMATARRSNGRPCPTRLPPDPAERLALVQAHVRGRSRTLTFEAQGRAPWQESVPVDLAGLCPASDGRCRWMGIDLDASDHGAGGLADPVHATRAIAERADRAGLFAGLLVARSRGGKGRHIFLMPPYPVPLEDAVIGLAALAAAGLKVAREDAGDYGAKHAFERVDGGVARLGDAGAVELVPRGSNRPRCGWPLQLPCAGVNARTGGGVIVDPFEDRPERLRRVPRTDPQHWSRFISEARAACGLSRRSQRTPLMRPLERADTRTHAFLRGRVPQGMRNTSAFAASANLLGCGMDATEAEQRILGGAAACGLPQREARAAFVSAVRARRRKERV